jgi:hypothetical protein
MADYNITLTTGAQGVPGQGVKPGGNTGEYLIKSSNADFDTAWIASTAVVNDIGDIGNVNTTGAVNNDILVYSGGDWVVSNNYVNTAVLTTGLAGKANTSHTHVKADITDFDDLDYATNAQGVLADSAVQPGDDISLLNNDSGYLTVVSNTNIVTTSPEGCVLTSNGNGGTYWNLQANTQWGTIEGTLSSQTDLQSALDGKANTVHTHVKADITDFDETDYASNAQGLLADSALQPGDNVSVLVNDAGYLTSVLLDNLGDVTITSPQPTGMFSNSAYLGTGIPYGGIFKGYEILSYSRDANSSPETYSWKNITINEALSSIGESPSAPMMNYGLLTYDRAGDTWVVVGNQFFEEGTINSRNANDVFTWSGTNYVYDKVKTKNISSETATDGYVLTADGTGNTAWEVIPTQTVSWGDIAGTLSTQTDLQSALDGKADTSHTHVAADIDSETATDGYVLTADGAGGAAWEAIPGGGGGITDVVQDTTPQLGGDLDVNGQEIVSVTDGDIAITPNGTGKTKITNLEAPMPLKTDTTTSYTCILDDADKMITLNNGSAVTVTIPANSSVPYPIGTKLNFMQLGAGQVTVTITSDTLNYDATLSAKLNGQYAVATALKITSTSWVLFGNLEPAA